MQQETRQKLITKITYIFGSIENNYDMDRNAFHEVVLIEMLIVFIIYVSQLELNLA